MGVWRQEVCRLPQLWAQAGNATPGGCLHLPASRHTPFPSLLTPSLRSAPTPPLDMFEGPHQGQGAELR